MLGNDAAAKEAIERCASCAERPVCETGALAGWLSIRPRACPNLESFTNDSRSEGLKPAA